MDRKTREIAEKTFDVVERYRNELLGLCSGQSVNMAIAVLIAAADDLMDTAKEIRERATERKSVWDLIEDLLKETRK